MEPEIFLICAYGSFEHQAIFWKEKEPDDKYQLYVYIHLKTYRNFFKRLLFGLRYAFGYKSRFGAWDEFIFSPEAEQKLLDYLKQQRKI